MCACSSSAVASAVVINRVQDVFENPVYEESKMGIEELDALFWEGKQYNIEHYANASFNAMHIGDFVTS